MKEFFHGIILYFENLGEVGLALMAFIESSVFPIPPDVLLIAMSLSLPQKALIFALICTVFSTLGGALGYALGKYGGKPLFYRIFKNKSHYLEKAEALYSKYGVWAVLGAAFTPLPYKVFTIASGIFTLNFFGFMVASFLGRGARFFIVGTALMLFGDMVKSYLELVIIGLTLIVIVFFVVVHKIYKRNGGNVQAGNKIKYHS